MAMNRRQFFRVSAAGLVGSSLAALGVFAIGSHCRDA
jgi:hypothetical protein